MHFVACAHAYANGYRQHVHVCVCVPLSCTYHMHTINVNAGPNALKCKPGQYTPAPRGYTFRESTIRADMCPRGLPVAAKAVNAWLAKNGLGPPAPPPRPKPTTTVPPTEAARSTGTKTGDVLEPVCAIMPCQLSQHTCYINVKSHRVQHIFRMHACSVDTKLCCLHRGAPTKSQPVSQAYVD